MCSHMSDRHERTYHSNRGASSSERIPAASGRGMWSPGGGDIENQAPVGEQMIAREGHTCVVVPLATPQSGAAREADAARPKRIIWALTAYRARASDPSRSFPQTCPWSAGDPRTADVDRVSPSRHDAPSCPRSFEFLLARPSAGKNIQRQDWNIQRLGSRSAPSRKNNSSA